MTHVYVWLCVFKPFFVIHSAYPFHFSKGMHGQLYVICVNFLHVFGIGGGVKVCSRIWPMQFKCLPTRVTIKSKAHTHSEDTHVFRFIFDFGGFNRLVQIASDSIGFSSTGMEKYNNNIKNIEQKLFFFRFFFFGILF